MSHPSTEPRQKTLDLETACQMLDLVLGSRPHVGSFLQFLQVHLGQFVCDFVCVHLNLYQLLYLKASVSDDKDVKYFSEFNHRLHVHVHDYSVLYLSYHCAKTYICNKFIQEQSEYKAMNLDQWSAFLRFCEEVCKCGL